MPWNARDSSFFGGKIIHAKEPMHGKISFLLHDEKGIYENPSKY